MGEDRVMKRLDELKVDDIFYFGPNDEKPWQYRGNKWYGWPYSGGPYIGLGSETVYLRVTRED